MQKMVHKKKIFEIIKTISEINKLGKLDNSKLTIIYLHLKKSHFLVRLFVEISYYILNIFSLIYKGSFFLKLNLKSKIFIINKTQNLSFLKQDKLSELFHALIVLHTDLEEKEIKVNLKEYRFKNRFVENIVIGSGPSGSITALKLKEKNKDTLIIEKGNFYKNFKYKHPGNEFLTKWEFGGLSSSLGNSEIKYASAECFGGGSEINSGLYHEPDKSFVKKLIQNYNIKNLKHEDLIKNLRNIQKLVRINSMKLEKNLVSRLIYKTAKKIGWKVETIPRLMNNNFKKSSMTTTLLWSYIKKKGKVLLNANVTKIRKNSSLWQIKIVQNNKIINLSCKNLFICAGTINTLALLQKNNLIKKNKISKFHFHPMVKVIAKFPYKINDKNFDISSTQINNFFPQYIIGNASSTKAQLKINSYQNKKVYSDIDKNWYKMGIFHVTFSLGEEDIYKTKSKRSHSIL